MKNNISRLLLIAVLISLFTVAGPQAFADNTASVYGVVGSEVSVDVYKADGAAIHIDEVQGTAPGWLSIADDYEGKITLKGTPDAAGETSFTLRFTKTLGETSAADSVTVTIKITQAAVPTPTPTPEPTATPAPTATPTPTATPAPSENPVSPVTVKTNPSAASGTEGYSAVFSSSAENYTKVEWRISSADGKSCWRNKAEIEKGFPGVSCKIYKGTDGKEYMELSKIPVSLNGYYVQTKFYGVDKDGKDAYVITSASAAKISVLAAELKITKSPTSETVKAGEGALFIAAAENYSKIEWRVVTDTGDNCWRDKAEIEGKFTGVSVSSYKGKDGREYMYLTNIPGSMDGFHVQAKFWGKDKDGKDTFLLTSAECKLSVTAAPEQPKPTNTPAVTNTPTPTAAPTATPAQTTAPVQTANPAQTSAPGSPLVTPGPQEVPVTEAPHAQSSAEGASQEQQAPVIPTSTPTPEATKQARSSAVVALIAIIVAGALLAGGLTFLILRKR